MLVPPLIHRRRPPPPLPTGAARPGCRGRGQCRASTGAATAHVACRQRWPMAMAGCPCPPHAIPAPRFFAGRPQWEAVARWLLKGHGGGGGGGPPPGAPSPARRGGPGGGGGGGGALGRHLVSRRRLRGSHPRRGPATHRGGWWCRGGVRGGTPQPLCVGGAPPARKVGCGGPLGGSGRRIWQPPPPLLGLSAAALGQRGETSKRGPGRRVALDWRGVWPHPAPVGAGLAGWRAELAVELGGPAPAPATALPGWR